MCKLLIMLMLLFIPIDAIATFNIVCSDKINTKRSIQITNLVNKVETYFADEYNLKMEKIVTIYIVHGDNEYEDKLKNMGIKDYTYLSKNSQGITFRDIIVVNVNTNINSMNHVIAHEITHQYQSQSWNNKPIDMMLIEGSAEYIGYKFGEGLPIRVYNKGIKAKSYDDWKKAIVIYGGDDVYMQALYDYKLVTSNTKKL